MPELLFEIFCEEIPARLQRRAAQDLKKSVTDAIVARGLTYGSAAAFVTPRRLCLTISDIPARSPDTKEERKGPRVGVPEQALAGFLRGAGLTSVDQAEIHTDPKKGEYYVAVIENKGVATQDILAEVLPKTISSFPWGKPMIWGDKNLKWVRPIRSIAASFGVPNEDPETIEFDIEGIVSGQSTFGHRFMSPNALPAKRFDDYAQSLEQAKVVLDLDRRMDIIKNDAEHLAFAQGFELIADKGLLEEVAGLVEWPVVMMGTFSEDYLTLPEEVVVTTIKSHQKCFCLRDAQSGKLANKFILTSNMIADDGGKTIVAGNERVIEARLSDAMFFYKNDLSKPLEDRLPKLKEVIFHKKLGTQEERVTRLVKLAGEIAPLVGADVADAKRAALLAKADLVTEMVFEFTELQGLMGRYYATTQGEKPEIANAIEAHYKPVGPTDVVPNEPVAIVVALADKLDTLAGFWAIDEKPTGSRDPFALRRAALGVIRIILENNLTFPLKVEPDLLSFFHDRLKVLLRDKGAAHDLVDAVISEESNDLLEISRRVDALSNLLGTETGQSLLAGYRRGANILAAEEKKSKSKFEGSIDTSLLSGSEETNLANAISAAQASAKDLVDNNDFGGAITALSTLREPVDAFFEAVLVNDPEPEIRQNRLIMLANLRDAMHLVADFSKVSG